MAQWSGRGIPPTRRKLHRWRQQQLLEKAQERKESFDQARYDREWRRVRGDQLVERWGNDS